LRALEIEGGLEIVLAVDGSPDNSLEVCKQLAAEPGAPVTVLSLSRNFGEHNAVMAGLGRGARRLSPSPWTTTCRTRPAR
jgi:undecaprenyl-phosphate 4-deoxy-4-formamido-L-arabinose transferase